MPMSQEELQLIHKTAALTFPPATQSRLDELLDRKPHLTADEVRELDALLALNDELSAIKAAALKILNGRGERVA